MNASRRVLPWERATPDTAEAANRALIGMVHLAPLPGAPRFAGSVDAVVEAALVDARAIAAGGADAVMMENFGDVPFTSGRVGAMTVAAMTRVAAAIRTEIELPLGINVLRNDGESALCIAHAVGASFIRVNVLAGARVTDQGIINSDAHGLMRLRRSLGARGIAVLADFAVKHSVPLGSMPLADEVHDLVDRALADAVVVSGAATGAAVDVDTLRAVRAASTVPVIIGSGLTLKNAAALAEHAHAAIVGSSIKERELSTPVDVSKVEALRRAWHFAGA